jgi:hypothetical protein
MKKIVQLLLGLSLAVSALALWGLVRVWIPYSIVEAFAAEHQIRLWAGYLLAAGCVALALFTAYRKNYRQVRK